MKRIIATLGLGALVFLAAGCSQLRSRYEMNQGIQAYKNRQYPQAVEHFTTAVNLDPNNVNGKLYRATAWMIQYTPGAQTALNKSYADKARNGFLDVLKDDAKNERAMDSLAFLCLQEAGSMPNITPQEQDEKNKKLDEAKSWFEKVLAINKDNRDAWYSLGVIDWMKWYTPLMNAKSTIGMKIEDPGPIKDKDVRAELRDKYGAIVDDGIQKLQQALKIDKDYDDAMAYLNLLYRERADLAETPEQYKQDFSTAETYFQNALKAKQKAQQKAAQQKQQQPAE
jgi:tetratricopeptide (TPR) repeat protein